MERVESADIFPPGQRWDASVLLALGVFLLVARVPMAVSAVGLCSLAVILLQGLVPRRGLRPVLSFFATILVTSGVATARVPTAAPNGYFSLALAFALLAGAVLFSGSMVRNLRTVLGAVFAGLWFHYVLAMVELVSGLRILALRDPEAGVAANVHVDPWIVTSLFVNYNDYSVAMVIFVDLLVARLCFPTLLSRWQLGAYHFAALSTCLVIVMIGSRGALLALVFTLALLIITVVRQARPWLISTRRMWILIVAGLVGFLVAWNTPYFQSHSTMWREQIIRQVGSLLLKDPVLMLTGYASQSHYDALAAVVYPGQLMNPHNLFVEIVIAYGLPGLIAFALLLGWIGIAGVIRAEIPSHPLGVAAVVTALGLVVYGAVPSSYLDYGYPYLLIIVGVAALWLKRFSPQLAATIEERHHCHDDDSEERRDAPHDKQADHR